MTIMTYEYAQAVNELCAALRIDAAGLRIYPMRITTRTGSQQVAGFIANPDYSLLDYGSNKESIILHTSEVAMQDHDLHGATVRYGYCPVLHVLLLDEKWLNERARGIADGD